MVLRLNVTYFGIRVEFSNSCCDLHSNLDRTKLNSSSTLVQMKTGTTHFDQQCYQGIQPVIKTKREATNILKKYLTIYIYTSSIAIVQYIVGTDQFSRNLLSTVS